MARAVAALLSPKITAAVDRAVAAGITQLRKEMGEHAKFMSELEHHLSDLDDEVQGSQASDQQQTQTQQYILEKINDFENRSRRNNPRVIGLPESFNVVSLLEVCAISLHQALGITTPCVVEIAHRLGTPSNDCHTPGPIIVCYLNYME